MSTRNKDHAQEPAGAYATAVAPQRFIRIHQQGHPIRQIAIDEQQQYFFKDRETFEHGLSYDDIAPLISFLGYNQLELSQFLDVNPSTISRWKSQDSNLGSLRSKNIVEVDKIIAKGVRIFGSEIGFQEWLQTTNTALGDQKPWDLLKNPFDVEVVNNALEALSWGSYL
ncbi:MAG TPA: DUF2384 domain-containing protein [Leeuwenhoekiella sp.]|nr:DUF2384 domain-containing protein [Leeuwenhoekiella sp.]